MDLSLLILLASLCILGASEKWDDTVEKICEDGMHIADLLFKLKTVGRPIHPDTDAKVILLPAACIMSECSLMSYGDLIRHVTQRAKLFVDFLCTVNMGVPFLRRHCVFMQNSISFRASQSS